MQAQVTAQPRRLAPITRRTFGRFRLERRLAYGGMAEILLATDLRNNRPVALKRILPQYSSNPDFVQFFVHEGRLGQRLTHRNLVTTYEAGQVAETCYIALEYLHGAPCIELLRAAARAGLELPLGAAVRIVADAARGLHHAHTATDATGKPLGVVHRDVTPHNLFLCRNGSTKVLDFGIAKAASQLHVTRTGTIKGKFAYLAPEQIRGEHIDHRVDVFALGIVLHEMLTLRPLFRGGNDAETLERILKLEVPPPERVRHAVPPGLGAVALRALMRDRERRLPSAEALADSIEAVAEAECIDASPEVVATLLAELCPPGPDEAPALPSEAALDFEPVMALGATASASLSDTPAPLADTPVARSLPPPLPLDVVKEESAQFLDESLLVPEMTPVTLGHGSGSAPAMETPSRARWLAPVGFVGVGVLVLLTALLLHRARSSPPPPPPRSAPPVAIPDPVEAPRPVERPMLVAAEGRLRVDGADSFVVDGKTTRASADGTLHLAPGRHRVVANGPLLATPRSFEVELRDGETVTRALRPGRGRLRLAVTPWAEVQLDGRAAGTTPLQPIDLVEGAHFVTLKNGELGANVKKRVVVLPNQETALKIDLFAR
jgi:serine/threonine-protein kinase